MCVSGEGAYLVVSVERNERWYLLNPADDPEQHPGRQLLHGLSVDEGTTAQGRRRRRRCRHAAEESEGSDWGKVKER